MKKIINLILLFMIILGSQNIFASTKVYERTEENLGVNKNFFITQKRKDAILNTLKVDSSEKIYDFADLFTEEQEKELYKSVNNYIIETNMDMAIVTIDDNPKDSAMEYADDFYDYNDFGFDGIFSGVIFLIDMDTRKIWMSTTGNAILMYNDARINDILDCAIEYKEESDYKATETFIGSCLVYAKQGIPEGNENYYIDSKGRYRKKIKAKDCIIPIIISAITGVIITYKKISKEKDKIQTNNAQYYVKYFEVTKNQDIFLREHTSSSYIGSSSDSSGGSSSRSSYSSSRSSTHSSSSGRSHGGGGRSF